MKLRPNDPTKKHDALIIYDCKNGNPNGDPNADNLPRFDMMTNLGYATDVCLKFKLRSAIEELAKEREDARRYNRLIKKDAVINQVIEQGYIDAGIKPDPKKKAEQESIVLKHLIDQYFDLRFFGGVLSTGKNKAKAGTYDGPIQVTFAQSFDPVRVEQIAITRCAATEEKENKENKTMGRKAFLRYGLYSAKIFFSPHRDKFNLITEDDLELFWTATQKMFEFDRSAARGDMALRGLFIFSHAHKYGDVPAHKLFDSIEVKKTSDDEPNNYSDYSVNVNESLLTDFSAAGGVLTQFV
jgi:CRISPR-associated protein Csd2